MKESTEVVLARIGANVKRLRAHKKLSLRELSYLCNLDNSKISKIESGQFNITIGTLLELADALEVNPSDLFKEIKTNS